MKRWLTIGLATLCAVIALLGVAQLGCVATPQPDPPNSVPHVEEDLLFTEHQNMGALWFAGAAGAVTPPEAVLRVYNLDNDLSPVDEEPAADGSFSVEIEGNDGDELRLQAIHDVQYSLPVDITVVGETVQPAPRPLADCLTTSPDLTLFAPIGGMTTVEIRNDCAEDVAFDAILLRVATSPYSIGSAPAELAAGERGTVVVVHDGTGAVRDENILLIEIAAPEVDRRPITLIAWD